MIGAKFRINKLKWHISAPAFELSAERLQKGQKAGPKVMGGGVVGEANAMENQYTGVIVYLEV